MNENFKTACIWMRNTFNTYTLSRQCQNTCKQLKYLKTSTKTTLRTEHRQRLNCYVVSRTYEYHLISNAPGWDCQYQEDSHWSCYFMFSLQTFLLSGHKSLEGLSPKNWQYLWEKSWKVLKKMTSKLLKWLFFIQPSTLNHIKVSQSKGGVPPPCRCLPLSTTSFG